MDMRGLTDTQKEFVRKNHPRLSAKQLSKKLKVDRQAVVEFIAQLSAPRRPAISRPKQRLFTIILAAFPFVFFLLLEAGLRLAGYGNDLRLFVSTEVYGRKFYLLNQEVAKRYFTQRDIALPNPRREIFEHKKSPQTYRIFCLGESTTEGFPYGLNVSFPDFLYTRLNTLFPGKNIEVINLGISAISSYAVWDFTRELLDYAPDLLLIYLGHNEFYGAFGVGSTEYLGKNRQFVKFYLRLQRLRLFALLRDLIGKLQGQSEAYSERTLMRAMVKEKLIPLDSPLYRIAADNFRANLLDIVDLAKSHGIGVIVGNLVSNEKDFPPFVSVFAENSSEDKKQAWQKAFAEGKRREAAGDFPEAISAYRTALAIDSTRAEGYFRLGTCLYRTGRFSEARQAFIRACDSDALRFRASAEFNTIIAEVCQKTQTPLVNLDSLFRAASAHGIIGNELITEHLHPNGKGYFLMAKGFFTAIAENDFIAPKAEWNWQRDKSDEEYWRLSAVTPLDLAVGALRIEKLTQQWPFNAPVHLPFPGDPADSAKVMEVARRYYQREMAWNDAHYEMAKYYQAQERFDLAEQEYRAVIRAIPVNYYPYFKIGDLAFLQKRYDEAEKMYREAQSLASHSAFVAVKLGMAMFLQNRFGEAAKQFSLALESDRQQRQLNRDENFQARYFLAISQANSGEVAAARKMLQELLAAQPNFVPAQELLAKLQP